MNPISPKRIAVLVCVLALLGTSCAKLTEQLTNLPKLTSDDLRFKPAQSSFIYDGDGRLITTLHGTENRTVIPFRRIPDHVRNAVLAIEDERFYEHEGVDLRAIFRALVANAASGSIKEGGSTITQQYVKNIIIAPRGQAERTIQRKLNEAALSRQLEKKLSKNEILERYLNTVYFGQGAYGIQAAARTFFNKTAIGLSAREAATLAGLIRAPEDYDPIDQPKKGRDRRNLVLTKMAELGYISEEHAAKAKASKLRLNPGPRRNKYPAPYFVDYVRRLIKYDEDFKEAFEGRADTVRQREQLLLSGGMRIYTTIDLDAQAAAERAVWGTLTEKEDPYGSLVAVDPRTGHIKAMVGGRNFFAPRKKDRFAKLNLAVANEPGLDSKKEGRTAPGFGRQAGSAFKTFALAAAIEQGTPLSQAYSGKSPRIFAGADSGGDWTVRNYESGSYGKLSLLEATVKSVNVIYAKLILDLGPATVTEVAHQMGIRTPLNPVPSAVLGANEVNPLGMASAYGTLATNGRHHPPVAITKIVDARGRTIYKDETKASQVIDEAVSYLTTTALEQVVDRGTGVRAQLDGRDVAGKTGTAQEYRDAWFAGYTPDLAAAVWVGHPKGQIEMQPCGITHEIRDGRKVEVCRTPRIGNVTGGSWPAEIWQKFMLAALAGTAPTEFEQPDVGLVTVAIDTRNGCLVGPFTPDEFQATAQFAPGTEPEKSCREPGDRIKVPSVVGLPQGDAERILEDEGFAVFVEEEPTTDTVPGRVLSQSPDGGSRATPGSTVTITVSRATDRNSGRVEGNVPDVLGMSRGNAEDTLRGEGYQVETIIQRESSPGQARKHSGEVWKQSPSGGSNANQGSTVTIWVNP